MGGEAASGLWAGFGLRIRSAIALPGAVPIGDGAADVEIGEGPTPSWTAARSREVYRVASADLFEIAVPGLARFTCLDRRRVVVDALPGADGGHVADLLVATVLPALLWARGEVVLHAAAFAMPGAERAVAIAGASGSGKSTALARALALGGRQVGDDSIRVGIGAGEAAIDGLAGGHVERRGDARVLRPTPPAQRLSGGTLGLLAVLTPGTAAPRRLAGVESLAALLRHRHRPRIAALLGTEAALLEPLAAIARAVPVVAVPMHAAPIHAIAASQERSR